MKLVLWAKGERGLTLLNALKEADYTIAALVLGPGDSVLETAVKRLKIPSIAPRDPHDAQTVSFLRGLSADVFVLNGYRRILRKTLINLPKKMCINLHGGKLPEYRGSSPMNWALINGERSFGLSVIHVDEGIDTGAILAEKQFSLKNSHTICDLHAIANREFPVLALRVLSQIKKGTLKPKKQSEDNARYFPARSAADGLVIWDLDTAEQIHNRIRALTEPYPCAFTYFRGRKIKLIASELVTPPHHGEPGKVYGTDKGLLVCAKDKCLRILEARNYDTNELVTDVKRYDVFLTCRAAAAEREGSIL